jgi:hypothetical protein
MPLPHGYQRGVVAVAAAVEVISGLVLVLSPSLFIWLLLAADLTPPGIILGRLAGIALLALAWACWPTEHADGRSAPALLFFSLLAAVYLIYVGISREAAGVLLWPAIVGHVVLAALLAAGIRQRGTA